MLAGGAGVCPRTGSLGSTRQLTPHPCRQFQLFYTHQKVPVQPPLKCCSALSPSWIVYYPANTPLFHLQGQNRCLWKMTLFSDLELSPRNEPGVTLKSETFQQEIQINAPCSVSTTLLVLALWLWVNSLKMKQVQPGWASFTCAEIWCGGARFGVKTKCTVLGISCSFWCWNGSICI